MLIQVTNAWGRRVMLSLGIRLQMMLQVAGLEELIYHQRTEGITGKYG
ncbi:MAG: hypothetical protein SNJ85_04345 [Cyanobacteriota bacterium]